MATYLLPCECGKKISVTEGQSGAMVHCECGRAREVPRVRELRDLRQVVVGTPPRWTGRHSLMFLGASMLIGGLALVLYTHSLIPPPKSYEQFRKEFQRFRPIQADQAWQQVLRHGPNVVEEGDLPRQQKTKELWTWIRIGGVLAALGLCAVAGSAYWMYLLSRPVAGGESPSTKSRRERVR